MSYNICRKCERTLDRSIRKNQRLSEVLNADELAFAYCSLHERNAPFYVITLQIEQDTGWDTWWKKLTALTLAVPSFVTPSPLAGRGFVCSTGYLSSLNIYMPSISAPTPNIRTLPPCIIFIDILDPYEYFWEPASTADEGDPSDDEYDPDEDHDVLDPDSDSE